MTLLPRCHHMRCFTGPPVAGAKPAHRPVHGGAPPLFLPLAAPPPRLSQSLPHMGPAGGRHRFDDGAEMRTASQPFSAAQTLKKGVFQSWFNDRVRTG
ncbi:hypothetical protein LMH87_005224 [Akanthomyces muscarius]|uniref:Uncharacterized protein n=1 Tax=Akanthomyces muscarius TaxID=2231603 RepID=A0A9W8QKA7_AKAMU|nr:hypothetical protein LMH87_005224 [Akanthomyces muscarius]KAJ4163501.1 hypothetical protein LMH87_005224 [Akanthomyces muscarius]